FLLTDRPETDVMAFSDQVIPTIPQSTEVNEKNPWAAFFLSWLIPGGGQFYNGENTKGGLMLLGAATGVGILVYGVNDKKEESSGSITQTPGSTTFHFRYEERSNETAINIGAAVLVGSVIWSIIDAPISANRINRELRQASLQINPVVADDLAGVSLTLKF
ncbi:MAG: hypothetical protein OXG98_03280, partial [Gemmatimonadetes bacterium]|nr:hypothetical protein [Gemmatimonadota bacterium]